MKQTSNAEHRTLNAELQQPDSEFDVRRSMPVRLGPFGVRRFFFHPFISRVLGILIGALFIYAGIIKVMDPIAFARDIDNYKMVSWPVAVALGFFLPWLEIASGVALVTRWLERGGVLILGGLTIVFIAASIIAKARGLDISCGCFGHMSKDWSFGRHLALDFVILGALAFLWWRSPTDPVSAVSADEKSLASVET